MPRTKTSDALPDGRPAGVTDEQWTLASKLGNISKALKLLDAYAGEMPDDAGDVMDLLSTAHDLERKSMNAYIKFSQNYGPKMAALRDDYLKHRAGAGRIFEHVAQVPSGRNGSTEAD